MAKDLSENDKKFVERSRKHFEEKAVNFVNSHIIGDLLARDLPVFDSYYIMGRVRAMLSEKYAQIDFNSEVIIKARMELLKQTIAEAKIKKVNRPKEKDEFAQQRADRCEPVCRSIVEKLLNEDLLLSNPEYLPTAISEDDRLLLYVLVNGFVDHIDNSLELGAHDNRRRAEKAKWDGKEPEEITWKDLDKALTKPKE